MDNYHKIVINGIFSLIFIIASTNAHATKWVLDFGIHSGGDSLASITFMNGDTSKIKGGALMSIGGGLRIDLTDSSHIRSVISWKFDSANASNGDIDFDRFPVELIYFRHIGKWNLGAGFSYHIGPKLSGSGIANGVNASFDDALGFVAEVNYWRSDNHYIGGKFTVIDYELKNSDVSVSGNSVGIVMGFVFGN